MSQWISLRDLTKNYSISVVVDNLTLVGSGESVWFSFDGSSLIEGEPVEVDPNVRVMTYNGSTLVDKQDLVSGGFIAA